MSSTTRNRAVLLFAAMFGILSAVLVFAFLNTRTQEDGLGEALREGQGAESVVVVARDILPGETVTADMLTTKALPASVLLTGRVLREEDVVGKVATAPMYAGEQVLLAKVTTYEGQNTLSFKVPAGMRALSVMVPHEAWANGGLTQPGDRIDFMAVTIVPKVDPLTGQERSEVVAGMVVEDVEVLAVSQALVKVIPNTDQRQAATASAGTDGHSSGAGSATGASAPVAGKPTDEAATYEKAISVTLAVTPEQAAKILIIDAMKDDAAQFRIVTRQKGDTSRVTGTPTWTLDDVFQAPRR